MLCQQTCMTWRARRSCAAEVARHEGLVAKRLSLFLPAGKPWATAHLASPLATRGTRPGQSFRRAATEPTARHIRRIVLQCREDTRLEEPTVFDPITTGELDQGPHPDPQPAIWDAAVGRPQLRSR